MRIEAVLFLAVLTLFRCRASQCPKVEVHWREEMLEVGGAATTEEPRMIPWPALDLPLADAVGPAAWRVLHQQADAMRPQPVHIAEKFRRAYDERNARASAKAERNRRQVRTAELRLLDVPAQALSLWSGRQDDVIAFLPAMDVCSTLHQLPCKGAGAGGGGGGGSLLIMFLHKILPALLLVADCSSNRFPIARSGSGDRRSKMAQLEKQNRLGWMGMGVCLRRVHLTDVSCNLRLLSVAKRVIMPVKLADCFTRWKSRRVSLSIHLCLDLAGRSLRRP